MAKKSERGKRKFLLSDHVETHRSRVRIDDLVRLLRQHNVDLPLSSSTQLVTRSSDEDEGEWHEDLEDADVRTQVVVDVVDGFMTFTWREDDDNDGDREALEP